MINAVEVRLGIARLTFDEMFRKEKCRTSVAVVSHLERFSIREMTCIIALCTFLES